MDVEAVDTPAHDIEADVLGFAVPDPVALPPEIEELDRRVGGRLAHLVDDGELDGTPGTLSLVHTVDALPVHRVAAIGIGGNRDADALRTAAATVASRTGRIGGRRVAWLLDANAGLSASEQARAVVEGVLLGRYDAARWKTKDDRAKARRTHRPLRAGRRRDGTLKPGRPRSSRAGRTAAATS